MAEATDTPLRKTPLHARHIQHGARMVPFGGWDMPVEYSGISDEHLAVRTRAGLFDVSHMGEVEIAGADALAAVQRITSNDASKLAIGQIQYSALMTPQGTFVDDLLVYRWADSHFLLVINAGNIAKDFAWISEQVNNGGFGDAVAVNSSSRYALLAVQGPEALGIVQSLTSVELAPLKYYWFAHGEFAGIRGTVSRTGYTGEDGFEIFVPPAAAEKLWNAILEAGKDVGLVPAGLGARDTLRLEASMRLYGNDIDETTTVLEADLGWIVGWKKDDFLGADVLRRQKAEGRLAQAGGLRDAGPRDCAPWLRRLRGWREGWRRDQRHADAVPQEGDWHGVSARGRRHAGPRVRDRHPRPPRAGPRGSDAVLQASQELTCLRPI